MNIRGIAKRERLCTAIDWKDGLMEIKLSNIKLWDIADIIITYWNKKSVKEIAVAKYLGVNLYYSIKREDYREALLWIQKRLEHAEQYEWCEKIQRTLTETYDNSKSNANNRVNI
jgi:hypothetical protein